MNPLRVPPEMISEMAMGMGSQLECAKRHGYTDLEFLQLCTYPWFTRAVEEEKAKLESEGFTFHNKMAKMAESLLIETYEAAIKSDSVSLKLEVAKHLAKLGRLEPQPNQPALQQVGGFQLTIHFSKPPEGYEDKTVTLEAQATEVVEGEEGVYPPVPGHIGLIEHVLEDDNSVLAYEGEP